MRHLISLAAGLIVAASCSACGEDATGASRMPSGAQARSLHLVLNADLAVTPESLWLATEATQSPGSRLAVFVQRRSVNGGWGRAERLPAPPDTAGHVEAALVGHKPCVGYATTGGRPVVTCRGMAGWSPAPDPRVAIPGAVFNQLEARGNALYLLVRDGESMAVLRRDRTGWVRVGDPVPSTSQIARLSHASTREAGLELTLEAVGRRPGRRRVLGLRAGRWREIAPPATRHGMGPQLSGAVRRGSTIFLMVNDAERRPWRTSIVASTDGGRWKPLRGGVLNSGVGDAQGILTLAGGRLWAMWQQSVARRGGFEQRVYVARVDRTGVTRRRMTSVSVSSGPGSLDLESAGGRLWSLDLRPGPSPGAMHAAVTRLDDGAD